MYTPPAYGPPPNAPPPPPRTDAVAIVGLVCGILGVIGGVLALTFTFVGTALCACCPFCGVGDALVSALALPFPALSLALGLVARGRALDPSRGFDNRGLATASVILGVVGLALAATGITLAFLGMGAWAAAAAGSP